MITQNVTGKWFQGWLEDDCTNGCLLYYSYFNDHYELLAIYLSKQQVFYADADPKSIQQINFIGNVY